MAHQVAFLYNKEKGTLTKVQANNLEDRDRYNDFRCVSCGCRVYLNICKNKANYFSSTEHSKDCDIAKGHRVYVNNSNTIVHIDAMLMHEDPPPKEKSGSEMTGDNKQIGNGPQEETEEIDTYLDERDRDIRSLRALYDLTRQERSDYVLDEETKLRVGDLTLCDAASVEAAVRNGMEGLKLVKAKRCMPNKLNPPIKVDYGKIVLRDAYSYWTQNNGRKSVFFIVQGNTAWYNEKLKEMIIGKKGSDGVFHPAPNKNVIMLANWKKVNNPNYQIYEGELNSRTVFLETPEK